MTNCLFFALRLYIRRSGRGRPCQIVMRLARNGFFPHFLYKEKRASGFRLIHYVPIGTDADSVCCPVFRGEVRWGDKRWVPDPHLARTVENLLSFAKSARRVDIQCVPTRYGSLVFFKDQVDRAGSPRRVEVMLRERIDLAKADRAAKL